MTTQGDTVLSASNISVRFGAVQALQDVSVEFEAGVGYGLVGPNGAGKSTLVKVLTGLVKPDEGDLRVRGVDAGVGDRHALAHAGIRFVPQETSLIDALTVDENINLGDELRRGLLVDGAAMRRRSRQALARVGLADLPLDQQVADLSLPVQRLVMVAKELRDDDLQLLILDEPTAAMSPRESAAVLAAIRHLQRSGVTTVLVSHRFDEVVSVCDRIIAIKDGRRDDDWEGRAPSVSELVAFIVGTSEGLPASKRGSADHAGEPLLIGRSLEAPELSAIDITLLAGEVVGLLGRPGSGADQLLEVISGVRPAGPRGRLTVMGQEVTLRGPRSGLDAGVGYLSSDRSKAGLAELTVGDNLTVMSLAKVSKFGSFVGAAAERGHVARYVPRNLKDRVRLPLQNLSGGNRQRVLVARLVAAGVRIIALNNPTAGIDVSARAELCAELRRLADSGCAVIIYSSEAEELADLADRVQVFDDGRVTASLTGEEITPKALLSVDHVIGAGAE